jgi:hypothetical protein
MSLRYKGSLLSATPPTTTGGESGTATGVWTLEQQMQAQASSLWPSPIPPFGSNMRSLRFNSDDSAYLNRTPASAGNRKTWTWSGWVKISKSKSQTLFSCGGGTSDTTFFTIDLSSDALRCSGYSTVYRATSQVFRDYSAWYHIVVAFDSTQATANDRIKVYINGSQVTAFATNNTVTQNTDYGVNQAAAHTLSSYIISSTNYDYYDGYMTEVVFIDGQALTPSSFGQTNSTTGVWEPKAITGLTYGTNGFYLKFQDNSGTTATTLGKDSSGNGNNWTPNNFSVTAGAGNDSLVDTPYLYGTDTGAGGEVRGNYATWNPLRNGATLANGNLDISSSSNGVNSFATFGISSGKWYWEVTATAIANTNYPGIGVNTDLTGTVQSGQDATGYMYLANGQTYNNNSVASYGNSFTSNDVIGVALDMDAGKIWFSKNGTFQNSGSPTGGTNQAFSSITGTAVPVVISWTGSTCSVNFGQRPFAYTAPSGFKALNTQNLPTPTVVQGDDYFNTVLYTGNGSTQSITGVGFQPDFVWLKSRSSGGSSFTNNVLVDVVRGAGTNGYRNLYSNLTDAEYVPTSGNASITALNSDGFTLDGNINTNQNTMTAVAWNWKANGAGASNTQGTITSTVSANTTSGFSIVTYTGNASTASYGHGLGAAPAMVITKGRTNTVAWVVYHSGLTAGNEIYLNLTNTQASSANYPSAPTSTVVNLGNDTNANGNGINYVAYCFAPVAGFSAFGKYTGNGSADGPFVYTGFRPRWVLFKRTDTANNWFILDTARDTYNALTNYLSPDLSSTESTASNIADFVSNGFKVRGTSTYYGFNASGGTYIYAAFAENPFKYSLAR